MHLKNKNSINVIFKVKNILLLPKYLGGFREDRKQLVSIFCEGPHNTPGDNDETLPLNFFPSLQPTTGYFCSSYRVFPKDCGLHRTNPWELITAGDGVRLILMTILVPTSFIRLDIEEEAKMSRGKSHVLGRCTESTSA